MPLEQIKIEKPEETLSQKEQEILSKIRKLSEGKPKKNFGGADIGRGC